jgi:hypothetical protein
VAGDIDGIEAHLVDEATEPGNERLKWASGRQRRAFAMPWHIDRNDAMRCGKRRDLRCPGFQPHADTVDQHQRLACAGFVIGRS